MAKKKKEEVVVDATAIDVPTSDQNVDVMEHEAPKKTLNNTTANQAAEQVSDIEFWGDGNAFKLIAKASSKGEGWMKSTKAMEIPGVGCVVQVTTQQGDNIAEAVTFVPGVKIIDISTRDGQTIGRQLKASR